MKYCRTGPKARLSPALRITVLAMAFLAGPPRLHAAELSPAHQIAAKVSGFPRVVGDDPAAKRINAILQRSEDRLLAAMQDCARTSPVRRDPNKGWERRVWVASHGPRYLSLIADSMVYCGGAHPDSDTLALVFDLRDGHLINWETLLPATMIVPPGSDRLLDGGRLGMIYSNALRDAYLARYPAAPQGGISVEDWQSCREAVTTTQAFVAWPNASPRGLALQPADLPHAVAACSVPVTLPSSVLQTLGVSEVLTAALDAER